MGNVRHPLKVSVDWPLVALVVIIAVVVVLAVLLAVIDNARYRTTCAAHGGHVVTVNSADVCVDADGRVVHL